MAYRSLLSVTAGMLACGIPLWPVPYSQVSMPGNPSPTIWLFLGAIAGMLAGWLLPQGYRRPALAVAVGFVLAVVARVMVETGRDPTSHNLWPMEVLIVATFGLVSGAIGVGVVRLLQKS